MIDNLKVSKFNDGEDLIFISNLDGWVQNLAFFGQAQDGTTTSGYKSIESGYAYYNFNTSEHKNYVAYYNNQVIFLSKNICPVGCSIPDINSFSELKIYTGCTNNNLNCFEANGFSPTTSSLFDAYFENIPTLQFGEETTGFFWSSTIVNAGLATMDFLGRNIGDGAYADLSWRLCIRCI